MENLDSINKKVAKSTLAYISRPLNDDYFKYDRLKNYFDKLITFLLAIIVILAAFNWWQTYGIDYIDALKAPYMWVGFGALLLLYARLKIELSNIDEVHSEKFLELHRGDLTRKRVDVLNCLSRELKKVLRESYSIAKKRRQPVSGITITEALLNDKGLLPLFVRLALNPVVLQEKLEHIQQLRDFSTIQDVSLLLPSACEVAYDIGSKTVGLGELLTVIVEHDPAVHEVFIDSNIHSEAIKNILAWQNYDKDLADKNKILKWRSLVHPRHHLDRAMTAMETPLLNQIGIDMTEQAAYRIFLPGVERAETLRNVYDALANKNSIVIVGQPGVGKHRFLELLAEHMVTRDVPDSLLDKRLINISLGQLISGADTSTIAARIERLFYEAVAAGNAVLVIEDVHGLSGIKAGQGDSVDVASIVAEAVQQTGIMVIGTSSPDEYHRDLAGSSLGELLKKIELPEPDISTAIRIVETRAHVAEAKHLVFFTYGAIERLVKITNQYIHDRYLPRKATEHLDRLALSVKEKKGVHNLITESDVNTYLESQLHLPLSQTDENESQRLLRLEETLHNEIVGQNNAVKVVADAMRRSRSGVGDQARPIAVLLFLGPTGVGKTALAKALAKNYFNDSRNMLRLDMSEYQGKDGVVKLLGRRGQSSSLVSALRDKPFQVVLLDEFEKAALEVRNLFLQVFDDARITDGAGKTADFTNTIIIATSNAGADLIEQATVNNVSDTELDKIITEEVLRKNFSPELLNRFDDVVIFHPLTMDDVMKIARLMLNDIENRLITKGVQFRVSDMALSQVAKLGYDRRFGARPLRRAIQQNIEEPIAQLLLRGNIGRRDTLVVNSLDDILVEKGPQL